jgi:hypothetical protein
MSNQDVNECLADLIEITAEAEAAFHGAAGEVRSEEARLLLLNRAQRYGQATANLRAAASARGGAGIASTRPEPLRIGPADEADILGECERQETAVAVAFRDALDRRLPPEIAAVVAAEFETLLGSLGSLRAVGERAARQRRIVVGQPV